MRGKIVLAVALCLTVAALLGMAAAPAAAQDGCTVTGCHTTPPTGDAPAPHVPYVASVTDCTVCHVHWTGPPHPDARKPALFLNGSSVEAGYELTGQVGAGISLGHVGGFPVGIFAAHPNVVVHLQQRLWGATAFTDLAPVTSGTNGGFTFTVASPGPFASYRAIAQGHVGLARYEAGEFVSGLFRPKTTTLLPTPTLTGALHGRFTGGVTTQPGIRLGNRVSVRGSLAPADLAAQLTVRAQKRGDQGWVTRSLTVTPTVIGTGTATATYSWKWTPKSRGVFRVYVRSAATDASKGKGLLASYGRYTTFRVW